MLSCGRMDTQLQPWTKKGSRRSTKHKVWRIFARNFVRNFLFVSTSLAVPLIKMYSLPKRNQGTVSFQGYQVPLLPYFCSRVHVCYWVLSVHVYRYRHIPLAELSTTPMEWSTQPGMACDKMLSAIVIAIFTSRIVGQKKICQQRRPTNRWRQQFLKTAL